MTYTESKGIIECLRKNSDIFAFSTSNFTGLDPKVALHSFNVDPMAKPVQQKVK